MKSNDKLKQNGITICTCDHFDEIMRVVDINFYKILLEEKSYKFFLIYNISYKTYTGSKPLGIWLDNIDGFIKIYDGTRYLVLFVLKDMMKIMIGLIYIISEKSDTSYIISQVLQNKKDSYNTLPLEKSMTYHDVVILIM